jgi:hypothetical protein
MKVKYKSLYPSITLQFGIAPNTIIGRINIPQKVFEGENPFLNDKYNRGGDFIENLISDNIIEFCRRWLHLAGFKELLEDMQEYYGQPISCKVIYDPFVNTGKHGEEVLYFTEDIVQNPFIWFKEREINIDGTPR